MFGRLYTWYCSGQIGSCPTLFSIISSSSSSSNKVQTHIGEEKGSLRCVHESEQIDTWNIGVISLDLSGFLDF